MNYNFLIELLEGKTKPDAAYGSASGTSLKDLPSSSYQSRKRPESSGPQQLKARNVEKFQVIEKEKKPEKPEKLSERAENEEQDDEDENYE